MQSKGASRRGIERARTVQLFERRTIKVLIAWFLT
jgi:hypothetical protein